MGDRFKTSIVTEAIFSKQSENTMNLPRIRSTTDPDRCWLFFLSDAVQMYSPEFHLVLLTTIYEPGCVNKGLLSFVGGFVIMIHSPLNVDV